MKIFASNHICLRIPCQAILLIITNQLTVHPPDCPKSSRETEILRTPKARSGFSILTEEYLTFQTISPINHPYRDATHISIVASPLALFCRIALPAVHFLNNLHVELLAILLTINSLRGYMKVRLPIFSCNLALAFLANMLCISVLDDTRRARLFSFFLSAIPNYIGNYLYNCYLVEKT